MTATPTNESTPVAEVGTSYDDVLYPSYVHAQTHPDRLASLATLFGMQPIPVQQARVLELACGQGGNLIPIAVSYPDSMCLGIDLSDRQIRKGKEVVDALGLGNIELRTQSILDFPDDAGEFDYIIAHGVFSWVPPEVQEKILTICKQHLAENGVAIISYNTFPGWHQRRMIRDMMQFHTRSIDEPQKKVQQAKAFLTFMTQAIPEGSGYGNSLHEEFRSLANANESYLFHEQLEEINEPQYFHEFIEQAGRHQLQYLSEVELSSFQFDRYPPKVAEMLKNMQIDLREQYLDFLMRRTFRQTLLCHQHVTLDRTDMAGQLTKLRFALPAVPEEQKVDLRHGAPVTFKGLDGVNIKVGDSLTKAAFTHLANQWPHSFTFTELASTARQTISGDAVVVQDSADFQRDTQTLVNYLLQSVIAGAIQIRCSEGQFTTAISEKPVACPLARYLANNGENITNRLHRTVKLDPLTRGLITHLDGSTDREAALGHLVQLVVDSNIVMQHQGQRVEGEHDVRKLLSDNLERNLNMLGRSAFLIR